MEPIQIVVFKPGSINQNDREILGRAGIIAIESNDPDNIKQLRIGSPFLCDLISGDDIVKAALAAIAGQRPHSGGLITEAGQAAHEFIRLLSDSAQKEKKV